MVLVMKNQNRDISFDTVPYDGKLTVCYAASLSMLLNMQNNSLPLWKLEVLTTQPFGFFYLKSNEHPFAGNGMASTPSNGILKAAKALGLKLKKHNFESFNEAHTSLRKELDHHPVILGPLDMGFLPQYGNGYESADHYVVGIRVEQKGGVTIHDPEGYMFLEINQKPFSKAWEASRIAYESNKFNYYVLHPNDYSPLSEKEQLVYTLQGAIENTAQHQIGEHLFFGPRAIKELIDDVNDGLSISSVLPSFSLEMANQRCWISAWYMKSMSKYSQSLIEASNIRFKQSHNYGKARLSRKKGDDSGVIDVIQQDLELETNFENLLQDAYNESIDRTGSI